MSQGERNQTSSLCFLNGDVQRAVIDQERKDNIIANYAKDSSLPFVDVEVKNVSGGSDGPPASPTSSARRSRTRSWR